MPIQISDVLPRTESGFSIAVSDRGTRRSVELVGVVRDSAARDRVKETVGRALGDRPECVLLDLTRLAAIDDATVLVIVELARRAFAEHVRFVVLPGSSLMHRALARHQLDGLSLIPVERPSGAPQGPTGPKLSWRTFLRSLGC